MTAIDYTESVKIDHNEYPQTLKSKSESELRYIVSDCKAALQAYPENPKAGYYLDEINYCAMELAHRSRNNCSDLAELKWFG